MKHNWVLVLLIGSMGLTDVGLNFLLSERDHYIDSHSYFHSLQSSTIYSSMNIQVTSITSSI
jgi:hypothetical protein